MKKLMLSAVVALVAGRLLGAVSTGPGDSSAMSKSFGVGTNTAFYGGWSGDGYVNFTNVSGSDLMLLYFNAGTTVPNGGNRAEIGFGDLTGVGKYAKIFWNAPHDADSGELQVDMSGGFALGPGVTSGNGRPYLSNRRFQLGIGEYHHAWMDFQFDNQAKADDVLGYSLAARWVTTYWNGSSSVANYATLRGEAYDTAGDFGLTYYGNFDTTIGGVGNTNMLGGTPVVKLHGGTVKKVEIIGSISTTLGTSFATSSGSVQFGAAGQLNFIPGSPDSFLFNYNTSRDSDFVFSDGGNSATHYYLRLGANGNYIGKGGIKVAGSAGPAFADTPLEVIGSVGVSGSVLQTNMSSSVALDLTSITATLASSGLSTTVINAHKYAFHAILFVSDSTAADGVKLAFDGGAATATDFRCHALTGDTTLAAAVINTEPVALATTIGGALAGTAATVIEVLGTIQPSSSGTFSLRYAQSAHSTGTLTLRRGSSLVLTDIP